jgi:hypothetical protein
VKLLSELQWQPDRFYLKSPRNYSSKSSEEDPGCIINESHSTLQYPLIDFDVNEIVDDILQECELPPSQRIKPVRAIVRGSGGGKTRALVETRIGLLNREGVLALAITFNSKWSITSSTDSWPGVDSTELKYALSVCSRLLSVSSGIDLDDVSSKMEEILPTFADKKNAKAAVAVIRECLKFIVRGVNSASAIKIKNVVLLCDESKSIEDEFKKIGLGSILRQAVLNERIDKNDEELNAAVVVSSLSAEIFKDVTSSGRASRVTILPSRLNGTSIVRDWWFDSVED